MWLLNTHHVFVDRSGLPCILQIHQGTPNLIINQMKHINTHIYCMSVHSFLSNHLVDMSTLINLKKEALGDAQLYRVLAWQKLRGRLTQWHMRLQSFVFSVCFAGVLVGRIPSNMTSFADNDIKTYLY